MNSNNYHHQNNKYNKGKNAGHYKYYNSNRKRNNNNNNNNNDNNNNNNDNFNNNNNNNFNNNNYNNNNNNSYKPSPKIQIYDIKIGEVNFCLTSESLKRDSPNFFTAAFFGYFSESKTTKMFIERDPENFNLIVKYLRGYEVNWPINDKIFMSNLLSDVKFYGFEKLQILLEEIYENNFPKIIIPWKILTYASEFIPIAGINIKDVELERWNSHSSVYNTNQILINKNESEQQENNENDDNDDSDDEDGDDENNVTNNTNNDMTDNAAADNNNNNNNNNNNDDDDNDNNDNAADNANNNAANNANNDQNDANDADNSDDNADDTIIGPNPEKGLYRLEVHGKDALATITSNLSNGTKFENFTLKNPEEEKTFRALTESYRTPEGSLTLSPSLKLPFLKDACIEINGSKYYSHNDLSAFFGNERGKQLYFEEIVIRIDDGAFLMRARAWTIPSYYASQPFIHPVQSR